MHVDEEYSHLYFLNVFGLVRRKGVIFSIHIEDHLPNQILNSTKLMKHDQETT